MKTAKELIEQVVNGASIAEALNDKPTFTRGDTPIWRIQVLSRAGGVKLKFADVDKLMKKYGGVKFYSSWYSGSYGLWDFDNLENAKKAYNDAVSKGYSVS